MTANRESLFSFGPSGLTKVAEMREFAAKMHPDIGPMFGNDVVELTVVAENLRRTIRAINDNTLAWHAGEDGKARALNVIAVWTSEALAGRLHPSVEAITEALDDAE